MSKIYGLTFSYKKGQYLAWLSNKGLYKNNVHHTIYFDKGDVLDDWVLRDLKKNGVIFKEKEDYSGGHRGWIETMKKVDAYRILVVENDIQDNDWLLDMDDDTYMATDKIIKLLTPDKSLVGIQHDQKFNTKLGLFGHMSGAIVAMRGEYLKKVVALTNDELLDIQKEYFRAYNVGEIWDLAVSYLMCIVGATPYGLANDIIFSPDAEEYFKGNIKGDYFHFNYNPKTFMGEPSSRYEIPLILKKNKLI